MEGGTGSSSKGRLKSLISTNSNSASVRLLASSYAHWPTDSPTRPGRVLPIITAIFGISVVPEKQLRCFRDHRLSIGCCRLRFGRNCGLGFTAEQMVHPRFPVGDLGRVPIVAGNRDVKGLAGGVCLAEP